jgi:curved DNA-binding protein CbpA
MDATPSDNNPQDSKRRNYTPQLGVDYVIDFYAVAGVENDAEANDINKAINKKLAQYHPDRLEGLAPELRARGEWMARLLNQARGILVDPEKRAQFNSILAGWDGPISKTGDPVITMEHEIQGRRRMMTPEELAAEFEDLDGRIDQHAKYSTDRIDFLQGMIDDAGDNASEALRREYEAALLEYDRNLAIRESERADVVGIDIAAARYAASLDYSDRATLQLMAAAESQLETLRSGALSATAQRLAILSGEDPMPASGLVEAGAIQLPEYFGIVTEEVKDIAQKRQDIVEKRLANLQPVYPESELQAEAQPYVTFSFSDDGQRWLTFEPDLDNGSVNEVTPPEAVLEALRSSDYKVAIEQGYNVVIIPHLEQVDLNDLLNEALNKYVNKYYPDEDGVEEQES